jgi:hypothetical protein
MGAEFIVICVTPKCPNLLAVKTLIRQEMPDLPLSIMMIGWLNRIRWVLGP